MVQSRVDQFSSFQPSDNLLSAMVILQVDHRVIVGSEGILRTEDEMSTVLLSSPRRHLEEERTTFNGVELSLMIDR